MGALLLAIVARLLRKKLGEPSALAIVGLLCVYLSRIVRGSEMKNLITKQKKPN